MSAKNHHSIFVILGGFLFLFDRILKHLASTMAWTPFYIRPYLGWEYYSNRGIAFSLPIPRAIILLLSFIILIALTILIWKQRKKPIAAVLWFLTLGALSNFIDRLLFGATIDYFRVFTGVINLADVMIVCALVFIFLQYHRESV